MAELSMGVLIDIVDEEWMRDTLDDDDVPLPPGMAPLPDEIEDAGQEELPQGSEDKWQDLALHTIK
uniref:Anaphase-promoting complex subunit 13 n=1 Tax=Picea sitchensis TaxID=3332 RepID=A9NJR5_PICSI|nr:unknown [Picea sitchensis]